MFEEDEMALFRRVRIETSVVLPVEDSRQPGPPISNPAGSDPVRRDATSPPVHPLSGATAEWSRKGANRPKSRPSQGDAVLVGFM